MFSHCKYLNTQKYDEVKKKKNILARLKINCQKFSIFLSNNNDDNNNNNNNNVYC